MPQTIQQVNEVWEKAVNGTMRLVSSEIVEVEVPTQEELIAQKEAELVKMYEEIQAMKQSQG